MFKTFSDSITYDKSLSILRIDKFVNLSLVIVLLSQVLIRLMAENERSHDAELIGIDEQMN